MSPKQNGAAARIVSPSWRKAIRPWLRTYVATVSTAFRGLHLAGWGLLLGAIGLGCFYSRLIPRAPEWLVGVTTLIPWMIVFLLSFCNQAPFGPRPFRYSLIFAMGWYSTLTVFAEILNLVLKPVLASVWQVVPHILTYVGALSFIILVHVSIDVRRYEITPDASPQYPTTYAKEEIGYCAQLLR